MPLLLSLKSSFHCDSSAVHFIWKISCSLGENYINPSNMNSGMKIQTLKQDSKNHRALTDTNLVSKLQKLNAEYKYNPAYSIYLSFPRFFVKIRGKSRFL